MKSMFDPVRLAQIQAERDKAEAARDFQRRADEEQAYLDAPMTRRELLAAIDEVRNQFGGSGLPEQEAIYDAFDRLRDALS